MSRRTRSASEYIALAIRLAKKSPSFAKYTDHGAAARLTPQQKTAISTQAYRLGLTKPPIPRSDRSFIESARSIAKYAPALKKYKKTALKTKLTPSQKGAITRKENLLRYAHHLIPLKGKAARELKPKWFAPGIQAIQLDQTNDDAKLHYVNKQLFITQNGRTWLYWSLDTDPQSMKRGAEKAFGNVRDAFPMERIADLVGKAFRRATTREVYLWAASGRVGQGYMSLKQFLRWFNRAYGGYSETHKWVMGIAIRVGEPPAGKQRIEDDFEDEYEDDDMGDEE